MITIMWSLFANGQFSEYYYTIPKDAPIDWYDAMESNRKDTIEMVDCISISPSDSLTIETLRNYENLRYLHLNSALLGNVDILCEFQNLEYIEYQSKFFDFPECLLGKSSIKHLDFGIEGARSVPDVSSFKNLESLFLNLYSQSQLNELDNLKLDGLLNFGLNFHGVIEKKDVANLINLKGLVTLDIFAQNQFDLPSNICNLNELKHLGVSSSLWNHSNIRRIAKLNKLETVFIQSFFSLEDAAASDLSSLRHIKKLFLSFSDGEHGKAMSDFKQRIKEQLPETQVIVFHEPTKRAVD